MADAFTPHPVETNGDFQIGTAGSEITLGGFLCTKNGTLRVIRDSTPPVTIIEQISVSSGQFYGVPIILAGPHTIKLAGGARGTVLTR
jgi:hypothetical protein